MLHHKTIRRVHEWASNQPGPVTVYQVMDALSLSKSTVNNALIELMGAGFASRKAKPNEKRAVGGTNPPPAQQQYLWTVTGQAGRVARRFGDDIPPEQQPLELIECCPSVWEYGNRCAKAAQ